MGVLCDYFRAADDEAARKLMAATGGGPVVTDGPPLADAVEAKGIDPAVILGKLVGLALGVPWSTDLTRAHLVWPENAEDDPEYAGPWVTGVNDQTRDALAGIGEDRAPELAECWGQIEEFSRYADLSALQPLVRDFAGLASRARTAGESLYCWICL
jgi:hypothetical protein